MDIGTVIKDKISNQIGMVVTSRLVLLKNGTYQSIDKDMFAYDESNSLEDLIEKVSELTSDLAAYESLLKNKLDNIKAVSSMDNDKILNELSKY